MKTVLEPQDIEAIATRVIELLKPMLPGNAIKEEDVVFNKKALSGYLKLSVSAIDKMVSYKQIPYFKIQQGQSGGVRFYKRAIDKWIVRQSVPEINSYKGM